MMIPKIIHYCWFGEKPIPAQLRSYIKTWTKFCPDYEIKLWNETNFDLNCHPFVKAAYDSKAWAFVSDYTRLKVVYDYGGIYLDTDVELLKNLDFLLKYNFFIGTQQGKKSDKAYITTGLGFGADKNNNIVKSMMEEYDDIDFHSSSIKDIACPLLNTKAIKEYGFLPCDDVQEHLGAIVFPPEYFDPYSYCVLLTHNTISIHHYSATWMDSKTVLKRRIINMIGIKRIDKLRKIWNGNED